MTPRIEKTVFIGFVLLSLNLVGCSNFEINTSPTHVNTATSNTIVLPTSSPIPTETPIPTIEIDRIKVPDPHFSNPELFDKDSNNQHTVISNFASAMQIRDIDSIVDGVMYTARTDASGNKLVFMVTSNLTSPNGLETNGIPLLMAHQENGKWIWSDTWMRDLADANHIILEAPMQTNVEKVANQIFLSGELDASIVFDNFDQSTWRRVINNWEEIKTQLDKGIIPVGYPFNWRRADEVIDFASEHGMTIRSQHLLWGGDVPDSVYNGGFTKQEIKTISEFIIKVRVLRYNGITNPKRIINQWDIADEWAATATFPHDEWPFWLKNLGFPGALSDVAEWVQKANPNAQMVVVEDGMLHLPSTEVNWKRNYNILLDYISQNNIPVSILDIENNFWVYDPPTLEEMTANLKHLTDMGFRVTSETTVVSSDKPLMWIYPTAKVEAKNPEATQALIYSQNLQAYLDLDADQYGLGTITDAQEFYGGEAFSSLFRADQTPRPAYYLMLKVLFDKLH